jgi:MFS family permease
MKQHTSPNVIDSPLAWRRLAITLVIATVGGIGLWSFVVSLPFVQAEFGVTRAEASLPYTLLSIGFAVGGLMMGRLSDRLGIVVPVLIGTAMSATGYVLSSISGSLWQFALAHGVLIGIGASATFGPLMADVSHWFEKRRGIAVAIAACGNYLAGTIWPPIVQHLIASYGWRQTHVMIAISLVVVIPPLVLFLRQRAPEGHAAASNVVASDRLAALGISPNALTALLGLAAMLCCLAMAMPQVHIVAYCGDLGYGPARGAEMLSLMLGFGLVSRVATGYIADRIGGVPTLLVGSVMQAVALLLYVFFDSLGSLYVISALFGLFQGGIIPSYAIIIREYLPAKEAATRVGLMLMASLLGMALGGWLSGFVFDLTGSYRAAFASGFFWNLLNIMIALWLLMRSGGTLRTARA